MLLVQYFVPGDLMSVAVRCPMRSGSISLGQFVTLAIRWMGSGSRRCTLCPLIAFLIAVSQAATFLTGNHLQFYYHCLVWSFQGMLLPAEGCCPRFIKILDAACISIRLLPSTNLDPWSACRARVRQRAAQPCISPWRAALVTDPPRATPL